MGQWEVTVLEVPGHPDAGAYVWRGEANTPGEALGKAWGEALKTNVADALQTAADKLRGANSD